MRTNSRRPPWPLPQFWERGEISTGVPLPIKLGGVGAIKDKRYFGICQSRMIPSPPPERPKRPSGENVTE